MQELEQLLLPVAERLQAAAEDAVVTQREALAREQQEFFHQRQLQVEHIQQLHEQVSQLKQLVQEQREREHQLLSQRQHGEVEIRRLQQAEPLQEVCLMQDSNGECGLLFKVENGARYSLHPQRNLEDLLLVKVLFSAAADLPRC